MTKESPPLVATDARDACARPMDFKRVHQSGIPHRTVHIEIKNDKGQHLVWEREDGRLEIPGGHVDWVTKENRPESYEEAALRETLEELNLSVNWKLTTDQAKDRLRGSMTPVAKLINQVPSSHGNNNEWVTVFRLDWTEKEWGNPCNFTLGAEGNKSPCWLSLEEIEQQSLDNPMGINAALRLFLARRDILVPLLLKRDL